MQTEKSIDANDLAAIEGLQSVAMLVNGAEPAFDDVPQPKFVGNWMPEDIAEGAGESSDVHPISWPEPTLPGTLKTPDIPTDILPGVWGQMAAAVAEATQTPPALSVMCCIGILATLLQRRFEVSPEGTQYREPLSIWCCSVSPSGTRKTAVMGAYHAPLLKWEKLQSDRYRSLIARANAARSTAKRRIDALNQQAAKCKNKIDLHVIRTEIEQEELGMPDEVRTPRLFTTSATAERAESMLCEQSERLSVHGDEPGIFRVMGGSYSGGSQNIDVFLKGHAGSSIRVDRSMRTAHVDKPAVSFNVMIQPGLMSELAGSKGFRDSGLIARFLWVVPKSNVGRRNVRQRIGISEAVSTAYETAVNALLYEYLCEPGTTPKVQTLGLSDAAHLRYMEFAEYMEPRLEPGGEFAEFQDWASKLTGAAARLAAIFELAHTGVAADTVQEDSMAAAVQLCMLLIPHARAAYGLLGVDPVEDDAKVIIDWAIRQGGRSFTQRDAKQAMRGRFPSNEKFKKAADRLTELDCVQAFNQSNRGRRPSLAYWINPALYLG